MTVERRFVFIAESHSRKVHVTTNRHDDDPARDKGCSEKRGFVLVEPSLVRARVIRSKVNDVDLWQ